ncbi:hypothetical protein Y032_0049g1776 [Ancylostoma ceylanicum]|uniref:Reverse transcriptase RNase H-like domain-containing protein n=1 Tax=Ancylostoma ceylanicum TaxID=53326 RepID=A0A016UB04_9BILA|nr:hypothetical protein Y032_0049g1776 [Ancylostoma ceylanicum]
MVGENLPVVNCKGKGGFACQIEKEALALIFAVQKFHRFVHSVTSRFTKTDHKPLLAIFENKEGVPVYSANRLQRCVTTLLNYNFTIEYVHTKDSGQAEALSRLIATQPSDPEDYVIAAVDADLAAEFTDNCSHLPVSAETIRTATAADLILKQVTDYTRSGRWPKIDRNSPLWHYYNRRDTLTTTYDCLLTANRIVIQKLLHRRVLALLHKAPQGQTRMKMLARWKSRWKVLK